MLAAGGECGVKRGFFVCFFLFKQEILEKEYFNRAEEIDDLGKRR